MEHVAKLPSNPQQAVRGIIEDVIGSASGLVRRLRSVPEQQLLDIAQKLAPDLDLEQDSAETIRRLRLVLDGIESAQIRARNSHALQSAKDRAKKIKIDLVATGELVPSEVLAKTLCISRQAVHKGLKSKRFFALEAGGRELYYPAFFADKELREAGLDEALAILASENAWSKWLFFTTSSGFLGGLNPLEALKRNKREQVLTAARAYLER